MTSPRGSRPTMSTARSLFGEILDWMLAPLLLLWPVSIAVTYLLARSIASVPFDHGLETRASVLARQLHGVNGAVTLQLPASTHDWLLDDPDDLTLFQVRGPDGTVIEGNPKLSLPAPDGAPQPGIIRFRDAMLDGHELRVAFIYAIVPGTRGAMALVQIAETLKKRTALANDIIKGVILPQFVILPLVIMLVWFGLSRGLAPLHALQARIRERRPDDPSPLASGQAPLEIAPLVASFNDLLVRLDENTVVQKRFIAQAAHQMKTPLAGLRMQAELALRQPVPPEVQQSLEHIAKSSRQAARLVTQLLSLARAENAAQGRSAKPIDLDALARSVVSDWVGAALEKSMDLGYEVDPEIDPELHAEVDTTAWTNMPVTTNISMETSAQQHATHFLPQGNAMLLREMLSNLIDNAIRYTPPGGRITVRLVTGDAATLSIEVEDTGPGIPEHEKGHVLERFYRILGREGDGSGLGLAIVNEIATMHGGSLQVLDNVYQESPRMAGTLMHIALPRDHRLGGAEDKT